MRFALRTDVGCVRTLNEDAAYAGDRLFVVCDGMGGHNAGEVASAMTVSMLTEALCADEITPNIRSLRKAVEAANLGILRAASADESCRGMGTTLSALWADSEAMLLAQVGDSRIYLLRGGILRQCTHDHSMVAELVRQGRLTPEEARVHPQRNLITRAVGTERRVEVDFFEEPRRAGDRWLLCSDGLSGVVSDEEIAAALSAPDEKAAADELMRIALTRGAPDNVTLIVLDDETGGENA